MRWLLEPGDACGGGGGQVPQFALPDYSHPPSPIDKRLTGVGVAGDIAREFLTPIFNVRLGHARAAGAIVLMPEAAMYKDDGVVLRQHNVWSARQIAGVDAIAKTPPVK